MKTASDPRHQERQKTIQELFAWQAHKGQRISQKTKDVVAHIEQIDELIKSCAPEWEITRINQIDLAILRLGIYELVIDPQAPAKVIIDESVELAKEFGTETSPSFINGALGKALLTPTRIKRVLAVKFGTDDKNITDEANLKTDLNASDLEVSDLFASLEKEYNIVFDKENPPETVLDLITQIEEQTD